MLLYFFTLQLLGYRILRWLFNFTISWLFNFTKFWRYKVTYYMPSGGHRPTMVCNTVINPLLAMPFTPLSYGEGKAARARRGGGAWPQKQLSRYSQRAAAQCLCLTKNNFLYR